MASIVKTGPRGTAYDSLAATFRDRLGVAVRMFRARGAAHFPLVGWARWVVTGRLPAERTASCR